MMIVNSSYSMPPPTPKTVCGTIKEYDTAYSVKKNGVDHYISDDNLRPSDPNGVIRELLPLVGSCQCVRGKLRSFSRAGETAYEFTKLTSVEACQ